MIGASLINMVSHKQQVDSYKRKNYVPKPKERREDKLVNICLSCKLNRCELEHKASCSKLKQVARLGR